MAVSAEIATPVAAGYSASVELPSLRRTICAARSTSIQRCVAPTCGGSTRGVAVALTVVGDGIAVGPREGPGGETQAHKKAARRPAEKRGVAAEDAAVGTPLVKPR